MQELSSSGLFILEGLHIHLPFGGSSKHLINAFFNLRSNKFLILHRLDSLLQLFGARRAGNSSRHIRVFDHPCQCQLRLRYPKFISKLFELPQPRKCLLLFLFTHKPVIDILKIRIVVKPTTLGNTIVVLSCQYPTRQW